MIPASPHSPPKKPDPAKNKKPVTPPAKQARKGNRLFGDNSIFADVIANEAVEKQHHGRLLKIVISQTLLITVLAGLLIIMTPFMQPVYRYYALNPAGEVMGLDALLMPNMTNRAVVSWTITSVTEIMTMGFGDFQEHLQKQKGRFTPEGWKSFTEAFRKQKIGDLFKQNQLVLTTVPSDTAVILAQGQNDAGIYQWKVQMPVIMTYATNNNVTRRQRAFINLTIVRVPTEQSPTGVAIKNWIVL